MIITYDNPKEVPLKAKMKALVFVAPGKITLVEKPVPQPGPTEALIRITTTTICAKRVNLKGLVTHRFKLDEIVKAYDLFSNQRDGVLKVAVTP
jgi:threonine dehydrogenase-like Zn-dependent dehydrogenase